MSLSNDRPLIPSNVTWKDAVTINNSKETTEDHQFRTVSLASAWCFARFYNLLYPFWNHCYLVGSQQFNLFTNHTIFFLLHVTSVLNHVISILYRTIFGLYRIVSLSNTKWEVKALLLLNKPAITTIKYWYLYNDVNATYVVIGRYQWSIDRFQSRGQQLCKLLGIKESFNLWKESNSHRNFLYTNIWMKSQETCFLCFVQHGKWKPRELLSKEKRRQKELFKTWERPNYKKSTQ